MTKRFYRDALQLSKDKKKQLMVIGDPCGGTYFQFISDLFPNCEHGDVTLDLFGCSKWNRMDINDIHKWEKFCSDPTNQMINGVIFDNRFTDIKNQKVNGIQS